MKYSILLYSSILMSTLCAMENRTITLCNQIPGEIRFCLGRAIGGAAGYLPLPPYQQTNIELFNSNALTVRISFAIPDTIQLFIAYYGCIKSGSTITFTENNDEYIDLHNEKNERLARLRYKYIPIILYGSLETNEKAGWFPETTLRLHNYTSSKITVSCFLLNEVSKKILDVLAAPEQRLCVDAVAILKECLGKRVLSGTYPSSGQSTIHTIPSNVPSLLALSIPHLPQTFFVKFDEKSHDLIHDLEVRHVAYAKQFVLRYLVNGIDQKLLTFDSNENSVIEIG